MAVVAALPLLVFCFVLFVGKCRKKTKVEKESEKVGKSRKKVAELKGFGKILSRCVILLCELNSRKLTKRELFLVKTHLTKKVRFL